LFYYLHPLVLSKVPKDEGLPDMDWPGRPGLFGGRSAAEPVVAGTEAAQAVKRCQPKKKYILVCGNHHSFCWEQRI